MGSTKWRCRLPIRGRIDVPRLTGRDRANTSAFKHALSQRQKVEALFGELKNQIGLRRLQLRRIKFVRS
jgi:hypothetical protein